ncbi:MAG: CvpA family protein [Campylobacteraceae bacterium]|nr:CvpA family protein [Campylobacteraceae bacterium]
MLDFSIFDMVIIGVTLALGLKGLFKGFIKEISGLIGIIGGIFVASRFADVVGNAIAPTFAITSEATISLIGFVCALIAFWLVIYILGMITSKIFAMSGLGIIDRLFGFIFGSAKIFLILAVISHALYQVESFRNKLDTKFQNSQVFPLLLETGSYIVKLDTKEISKSIEEKIDIVVPEKDVLIERIEKTKEFITETSKEIISKEITKKVEEMLPKKVEDVKSTEETKTTE